MTNSHIAFQGMKIDNTTFLWQIPVMVINTSDSISLKVVGPTKPWITEILQHLDYFRKAQRLDKNKYCNYCIDPD